MDQSLVIRNGSIITSTGFEAYGTRDLLIENGKITGTVKPGSADARAQQVLDAKGGWILPGFIDCHCHGGGGYDFMDGSEIAFKSILSAHVRHGTTALAPTAVACDLENMKKLFSIYRTIEKNDYLMADLVGFHLEGPYLSMAQRGAQPTRQIRDPDPAEVRQILDEGRDIICRWTAAPERPGMKIFADQVRSKGITLSVGHSDAICQQIQQAFIWGFHSITHLYSGTTTVRKLNQVIKAGIVEAAYLIDDMVIELIGDGHHVPKEVIQLAHKIKGADKVILITDAMRAAGTDARTSYLGLMIPENQVIIEQGVAKLPDRSSYAGSIATMDQVFQNAVVNAKLPVPDVVKMVSTNSAKLIGIDHRKGRIHPGYDADIVILDSNYNVQATLVRGRVVFQNDEQK